MDLTDKQQASFSGGQLVIRKAWKGVSYCGEIGDVWIEGSGPDAVLHVSFRWLARGLGKLPIPLKWVVSDEMCTYSLKLVGTYDAAHGVNHIIRSMATGETLILINPKDTQSLLDPKAVTGFTQEPHKTSGRLARLRPSAVLPQI